MEYACAVFGLSTCGLNIVGCCSFMELKKNRRHIAPAGGDEVEGEGAAGCNGPEDGTKMIQHKRECRKAGSETQLARPRVSLVQDCPVCKRCVGLLFEVGII